MSIRRILLVAVPAAAVLAQNTQPQDEGPEHDRRRAEWFLQQRATPQGSVPVDLRWQAWRNLQAGRTRSKGRPLPRLSAATSVWQNVGPFELTTPFSMGPVSGRVNAIAADPTNPNVLYVGASEGGIWKSTDGGNTFNPVSDSQASLAIASLALDPSNPNIVYAGTGGETYGAGILKSTDGGVTWTNYPGPFVGPFGADNFFGGGARILSLVVSPANSNLVLAAMWRWPLAQAGIFRSTDGGATWKQVLAGPGRDIQFLPGSSTRLFATLASYYSSPAAGLYSSSDAGLTWTLVTGSASSPAPSGATVSEFRLAMNASSPATIYISVGLNDVLPSRIYKSTDTGATWSLMPRPPDVCCNSLIVDPADANLVIGGGEDLYRSADGAQTWADISGGKPGDGNGIHVDPRGLYFLQDGSAFLVGNDGGVYETADAHPSAPQWTALSASLTVTEFYPSMALHPDDPTIMLGGTQDNGTILGGADAWVQITCPDSGWSAIDPSNPSTMYTACQGINLQKSTAAGASGSWIQSRNGISTSDRVSFIPPLVMDLEQPQTLYFGTYRVYQTQDGAGSWSAISADLTGGGTLTTIAVAPSDSNTVYAASTDSRISATSNALAGAPTWTRCDKAPLPKRYITQVAVDPASPQAVYATFSGFSGFSDKVGHVFRSLDGGVTWSDISGNLPNIPANDIVIDPDLPGVLYVGTDLGVFASSDSGATWSAFGAGLPYAIVNALKLHRPTRTLRAATYGRGIWDLSIPLDDTAQDSSRRPSRPPTRRRP